MTASTTLPKPETSPGLRLLIDFGPLLLFFLVNLLAPVPAIEKIFVATGAFMFATIVAMIASRLVSGAISAMLWFNGAMVVLFGGLTLWMHCWPIGRYSSWCSAAPIRASPNAAGGCSRATGPVISC
jgi:hypothetical protein